MRNFMLKAAISGLLIPRISKINEGNPMAEGISADPLSV
jgi:hypothetical protein